MLTLNAGGESPSEASLLNVTFRPLKHAFEQCLRFRRIAGCSGDSDLKGCADLGMNILQGSDHCSAVLFMKREVVLERFYTVEHLHEVVL